MNFDFKTLLNYLKNVLFTHLLVSPPEYCEVEAVFPEASRKLKKFNYL